MTMTTRDKLTIAGFAFALWLYTGWQNAEQHDLIARKHGWDPKHLSAEQRLEVNQEYDDDRDEESDRDY